MTSDRSSSEDLQPGAKLGPFAIVRLLGQGGMASVYEGRGPDGAVVALKVLHPSLADDAGVRARFQREARMAARVDHPHVTGVRRMYEEDGRLFLEMEYLVGETLAALIARLGRLDLGLVAEVMLPVCAGLHAVHAAGIVHRDLKPENIFLARTADGGVSPRVLDFGISKLAYDQGTAITQASTTLGTVQYMSPEQVRGRSDLDPRADQYALGVVLYECATGRLPFQVEGLMKLLGAIAEGKFPRPSEVVPTLPAAFDAVVVRAMAQDREARYPDVLALGRELLAYLPPASAELWRPAFEPRDTAPDGPEVALGLEATLTSAALEAIVNDALGGRVSHERIAGAPQPAPAPAGGPQDWEREASSAEALAPPDRLPSPNPGGRAGEGGVRVAAPVTVPPPVAAPLPVAAPAPRRWPLVALVSVLVGLGLVAVLLAFAR